MGPVHPLRDIGDVLADLNIDCLGCLMDAHQRGDVDDETYNDILTMFDDEHRQQWGTCPACGKAQAFISQYEPDLMHCPGCGMYSVRAGGDASWQPFRQGTPMPPRAPRRPRYFAIAQNKQTGLYEDAGIPSEVLEAFVKSGELDENATLDDDTAILDDDD